MAEPASAHISDNSSSAAPDTELRALIEARHTAQPRTRELDEAEVGEIDPIDALITATRARSLTAIREKGAICRHIEGGDRDLGWPMLVSLMVDLQHVPLDDVALLHAVFAKSAVPLPPSLALARATVEDRQ